MEYLLRNFHAIKREFVIAMATKEDWQECGNISLGLNAASLWGLLKHRYIRERSVADWLRFVRIFRAKFIPRGRRTGIVTGRHNLWGCTVLIILGVEIA